MGDDLKKNVTVRVDDVSTPQSFTEAMLTVSVAICRDNGIPPANAIMTMLIGAVTLYRQYALDVENRAALDEALTEAWVHSASWFTAPRKAGETLQ